MAQQAAVKRYLNGGNWKVVETFTEVVRPQQSSVRHWRRLSPLLACARSRSSWRRSTDSPARSDFSPCCPMPAWTFASRICLRSRARAGRFMLKQMALVAELEAGFISDRTKAALAAA